MSEYAALLRSVIGREPLTPQAMAHAIGAIMDGAWSASQAGAFLAAMATKGETAGEIAGAATAMRERCVHVEHDLPLVMDVVGTGGDGAGSINISTCAAFVVVACGVPVAKHGNRAASSQCGSADVLEACGFPLELSPEQARQRLEADRFTFLFAQRFHPAMRVVGPIRRELGVRTLFNVLGPLTNPARATHQVVGVALAPHVRLVGEALQDLALIAGAVVHSADGLDEIAGDAPTHVFQFDSGGAREYTIDPADFGVSASRAEIAGGNATFNAVALRSILAGEQSPRSEVVALNAGLALVVAGQADSYREGVDLARSRLRAGAALPIFEHVCQRTDSEHQ